MFNRPGVAGPVLQTASSLINWLIQWVTLFLQILSSIRPGCWSWTGVTSVTKEVCICMEAKDLTFWENVPLPPHVTCHVSHVTCHISCVNKLFFFFFFQINGASRWRIVFHRGLPRLDFNTLPCSPPSYPKFYQNRLKIFRSKRIK